MSILESFLAGKEARRVADAAEQINAMNAFLGQNGAALMAGDQNAMAQLAGFGPQGLQMAMGMKGDLAAQERQAKMDAMMMEDRAYGRERDKVQDAREDQKWEMQLAEYKQSISAEQAAAEAAQLEEAAKMALTATSPEQWDQLAQENGAPELVGQFENREAVAARFMSMAEVLKANGPQEPAKPSTEVAKLKADLDAGLIDQATYDLEMARRAPKGTALTVDPATGAVSFQEGVGVGSAPMKPFTEAQSKDNVFATRASGALEKLESPVDPNDPKSPTVADQLGSLQDSLASNVPVVGNYMTGEGFQVAKTAGDEFLQAILRKDTGAAITSQEQALYGETYLPQPGDSKERLKYKKEARARAVAALQAGMSQAQLEAVARAEALAMESGGPPPEAPPAAEGGKKRLKFNPETGEIE